VSAAAARLVPTDGEPLSQALLAELAALIAPTGSGLSEYSLANLYLYRGRHHYRFHRSPVPHIRGVTYDGAVHALPLGPLSAGSAARLLDECDCIGPLGAEAPALAAALGLDCGWVEADSDYVYDAARLAALAGAKAKRAQARAFEAQHNPDFVPLTGGRMLLAEEVLGGWFADVGRAPGDTDFAECREALKLRDALGLEGWLAMVVGEPVGFILAGPAPDGSRIVHFAKGRRAYAGAYPWMFARYAARIGTGPINFEQDLGKPGFAQAKRAFAPAARLHKYRLRRRHG
jgi:hypothetical protein